MKYIYNAKKGSLGSWRKLPTLHNDTEIITGNFKPDSVFEKSITAQKIL